MTFLYIYIYIYITFFIYIYIYVHIYVYIYILKLNEKITCYAIFYPCGLNEETKVMKKMFQ